jgi:predicted enzyme related to lactoylglutathione lyase
MGAWYERHLGIRQEDGCASFRWRDAEQPEKAGTTVFSFFPRASNYFDPSPSPHMLNFRVADLEALLATLQAEGVTVAPEREDSEYGRFAWIIDPEGNRVELWEPPAGA